MTNRYLRNLIIWAVILAVAFPFVLQFWRRPEHEELDYSSFIQQAQAGEISEVTLAKSTVYGRLNNGQRFRTHVPPGDSAYLGLLKAKGVAIKVEPSSSGGQWPPVLTTLLPILVLLGLWVMITRRARSGQDLATWLWQKFAREQRLIAPPSLSPPRGFSHGILVKGGQLLFIAGQDASDVEGKIVAPGDLIKQFEQVLRNLNAVVQAAGGTLQDVVKLNVFVRDRRGYVANLKPIGEVFRRYFGGHYPAMAFFEVSGFFRDDALIEMEGIAALEHPRTEAPAAAVGP